MDQSTSTAAVSSRREVGNISELPDECLSLIFQSLSSRDRVRCSLVCTRWLRIQEQSCDPLSLYNFGDDDLPFSDVLSTVTELDLHRLTRSVNIGDDAQIPKSYNCRNLIRLNLSDCHEVTDTGIVAIVKNSKRLKKLSCRSCSFGAKGMNAILNNCALLEKLSVTRLRGITDGAAEPIGPGVVASSLQKICLSEINHGQCFAPLIIGAKNLETLKLFQCFGDWDKVLEGIADRTSALVYIHLERLQVSDVGLAAISNFSNLEILHLVKTPLCTNLGLVSVAKRCKLLRKLLIDGWMANKCLIGDDGLIAVAKFCHKLQELVLIAVNATKLSLEMLASNCQNLERLVLRNSDTIGDAEISCIAANCNALKKFRIEGCPVSDKGLKSLASGCPNLVEAIVWKCRAVICNGADWLRSTRVSLAVKLDTGEPEPQEASASYGEAQESDRLFLFEVLGAPIIASSSTESYAAPNIASGSTESSASFESRLACILGRISGGNGSS